MNGSLRKREKKKKIRQTIYLPQTTNTFVNKENAVEIFYTYAKSVRFIFLI